MLDMKERMMKSGSKDAAPATGKQDNQGGKGRKGHAGKNDKSDGASDRGKSPGGGKDNPCWYHFKSAKGCVKGNECTFSHSKKRVSPNPDRRHQRGMLRISEREVRQGERLQVQARAHQEQFSSSTSSDKAQASRRLPPRPQRQLLQRGPSRCPR